MGAEDRRVRHDATGSGERRNGTVTWVDPARGFAFISPDDGGPELFVDTQSHHIRTQLEEGMAVAFDSDAGPKGRLVAANVSPHPLPAVDTRRPR